MIKVSPAEFGRNFEHYRDIARTEPVSVVDDGEEESVLISSKEYARLRRRDREVLAIEDLTEEDIAAIEAAEPPPEAAAFDHEVES